MKRKIFYSLAVLAVVGGGLGYYAAKARPQGMVLTGIVTTDDVVVSSQIQGQLSRLLVKEGDTVRAGQLLAVIQPRELAADKAFFASTEQSAAAQVNQAYAALRYQEAQTRDQIRQAEASQAATQAQVAEAAADLERARLDYLRTESLFKEGIVPAQQLDQARTTFEAQKAHQVSLQKQLEAQRAAVALARSTQEQIQVRRNDLEATQHQRDAAAAQSDKATVRLDYTDIRAPIPAVVALDAARQGEVVNVGQPIISLIDPDNLWIRADVEETYIDRIRLGEHLTVRFPSGMEKEGTIFFRGVDADFATQRDVSRTKRDIKTFEVRVRVDNQDRRIWPGLTAYVVLPPQDTR
ncbi:MAG TPA: HlyD family efflux transporter periplasmic adaptor subunit [Candidatus Methylomirabilis sp.]|nr:HlyD family efflux transporter periplasmic adaptor subunit [Candidatus Methylomirabilis sp.]